MFRRSRMNQSRLPRRTTAVYSQGDRQRRSLATPAPCILPSDICEPHTSALVHTETSHLTVSYPPHEPPSHHLSQGYNTQCVSPPRTSPLRFVFATLFFERIHTERLSCLSSDNPSIVISQKGIMRLITYILI